MDGHTRGVWFVCAFKLADQTLLATSSSDQTIRIWDPVTCRQQRVLRGTRIGFARCALLRSGALRRMRRHEGQVGGGDHVLTLHRLLPSVNLVIRSCGRSGIPSYLTCPCSTVLGMAKAARMLAALKRDGWIETRRSGSHRVLIKGDQQRIWAYHDGVDLGGPAMARIARDYGYTLAELRKL
jgi:predicted RNA binding protein YcfA (HicA-like mRNA interferase family)